MLEAEFTVCWPSAQILKRPLLFCSLCYRKSNILLAENFKLLMYVQLFMASCCVQNSSFSLLPFHFKRVKHILAATPAPLLSRSILAPSLVLSFFFFWIRPASQICSHSSTLSLSNTSLNNFHIVDVETILRPKSFELSVNNKNAEDVCRKFLVLSRNGFFFFQLLGISFQN